MINPSKPLLTVTLMTALAACSNEPYDPIVDGPRGMQFNADLNDCRQLSHQKQSDNSGAIGGAVIGGLVGGAEEDWEGAAAGALVGGLIGSAEDKSETRNAQDQIVFNCMRGRGHNVVG